MVHHEFYPDFGINYVCALEPFALGELFSLLLKANENPQIAEVLSQPTLLDLRFVDLGRLEAPDIRRHLMKKTSLDPKLTRIPCAYLVKGIAGQAALRMANIFAELSGLSPEDHTIVTEDIRQALHWLADLTGKSEGDVENMVVRLSHESIKLFPRA